MIRFVPKNSSEMGEKYKDDKSVYCYVGYNISDNNRECGTCVFRLLGYSMEIISIDCNEDDETIEGLIRSALNYGANRKAYLADFKAEKGKNVAVLLGFNYKDGILTGEIPELLKGSCCKGDKKF